MTKLATALAFTDRHALDVSNDDLGNDKLMLYCRCNHWGHIINAYDAVAREQAKDSYMAHVQREREKESTT